MVYFDFDGTLADVWQRFYRIFVDASRISEISLENYIRAKKQIPKDAELAASFGAQLLDDYWEKKRSMLEDPAYLAYDRLIVPAEQICSFFKAHECRILTNRRHPEAFRGELIALGLGELWDKSIVLNPDEKKSKAQYLQEKHPNEKIYLVGDAEAESQAAQIDSIEVFLVRTGLRDPESIPFSEKCVIINSVSDFMNAFKEII